MKMLSDEQKYKELEKLILEKMNRPLTEKENGFLLWLCGWDMDTFNNFKGIIESMKKNEE